MKTFLKGIVYYILVSAIIFFSCYFALEEKLRSFEKSVEEKKEAVENSPLEKILKMPEAVDAGV